MKTKIYSYYSDPGHGWLKVSRKELIKLGIQNQISSYSYQRKDSVYLEEDTDMRLFVNTLQSTGIKAKYKEFCARMKMSKIRSYNHYSAV